MGTIRPFDPRAAAVCPFHAASPGECLAALGVAATRRPSRPARCASEDHDECPTYLAKMLRQLRPLPFQVQRDLWAK